MRRTSTGRAVFHARWTQAQHSAYKSCKMQNDKDNSLGKSNSNSFDIIPPLIWATCRQLTGRPTCSLSSAGCCYSHATRTLQRRHDTAINWSSARNLPATTPLRRVSRTLRSHWHIKWHVGSGTEQTNYRRCRPCLVKSRSKILISRMIARKIMCGGILFQYAVQSSIISAI